MKIRNTKTKYLHMFFRLMGISLMVGQFYYAGVYTYGDDTTLMLMGIIFINTGYLAELIRVTNS